MIGTWRFVTRGLEANSDDHTMLSVVSGSVERHTLDLEQKVSMPFVSRFEGV